MNVVSSANHGLFVVNHRNEPWFGILVLYEHWFQKPWLVAMVTNQKQNHGSQFDQIFKMWYCMKHGYGKTWLVVMVTNHKW